MNLRPAFVPRPLALLNLGLDVDEQAVAAACFNLKSFTDRRKNTNTG
jgi:hypothetical protein